MVGICVSAPCVAVRAFASNSSRNLVGIGRLVSRLAVVAAIAACLPSTSRAASTDAELLRIVKSLEARVNALEAENRKYRQEAQSARAPTNQSNSVGHALTSNSPLASYASVQAPLALDNRWSNVYVGSSFGAGVTQSRVSSKERIAIASLSPPPNDLTGYNVSSEGRGTDGYGANIDLFVGFNNRITSNMVAGLQFEGTISDYNFNSSGSRSYEYFNSSGPTGLTATDNFRPNTRARWMTSALARAGVLANSETLLYGIAGWSLAGFDYQTLSTNNFYEHSNKFLANGPTVGAGIERKIGENWSIRSEYRYTHFLPVNVSSEVVFSSSQPSTQTSTVAGRFENSMHVGRIGIAYEMPVTR